MDEDRPPASEIATFSSTRGDRRNAFNRGECDGTIKPYDQTARRPRTARARQRMRALRASLEGAPGHPHRSTERAASRPSSAPQTADRLLRFLVARTLSRWLRRSSASRAGRLGSPALPPGQWCVPAARSELLPLLARQCLRFSLLNAPIRASYCSQGSVLRHYSALVSAWARIARPGAVPARFRRGPLSTAQPEASRAVADPAPLGPCTGGACIGSVRGS